MVFHLVALMLLRCVVVEGIAVSFNGKYRLLADAVYDEKINVGVVVTCICQFLLREEGCVPDNLSEGYMA